VHVAERASGLNRSDARVALVTVFVRSLLLCLMPPEGLLTDNEEDYFGLAERFRHHHRRAAAGPAPLFDSSPHRALNEVLLGGLIVANWVMRRAQIVARLALIVGIPRSCYVRCSTSLD